MTAADCLAPIGDRYFEDYIPGFAGEYGTIEVDAKEVMEFAQKFDPQDMHVHPEKAANGAFGGLIASGWHTCGMMMRLYAEHYLSPVSSIASPGIDELRWLRPVRPGDALRIRVHILEAVRSRSKPDRGMVRTQVEVLDQNDEVVMSIKAMNMMRCRPASQPGHSGSREAAVRNP
jgi:acyl dehydratase